MSDSEDSNFSEDESERSSEAEEVGENEVRLWEGREQKVWGSQEPL